MKNALNCWYTEGRDFWEGVALLQQAGCDVAAFAPYLSEGFVPSSIRERLENQLLGCNFDEIPPKTVILQPISTTVPQPNNPTQNVENQAIAALKAEARTLHKRHADRHAQLHLLTTAAERLPIIVEIMETIIPELDDIYQAIRNGGVRKNDPNKAIIAQTPDFKQGIAEGFRIAKQMDYLKNRIFKLESANGLIAKTLDKTTKLKFEAELTQKRQELDTLTQQIQAQGA